MFKRWEGQKKTGRGRKDGQEEGLGGNVPEKINEEESWIKEDRIKKEDLMDCKEMILRNGSGRGKIIIHQGEKIRRKVDQKESGLGGKRIGRELPEEKGSKAKMIRKQNNFNYIIHAHHINIFSSKINYYIILYIRRKKNPEEI